MTVRLDELSSTGTALGQMLTRGARLAIKAGTVESPVLVSLTEPIPNVDPLDFFVRGRAVAHDRFFWQQPAAGFALAGIGSAHVIDPNGPDRFARTAREWRALVSQALIEDVSGGVPAVGPLLLGGFAFDPEGAASSDWRGFPDTRLVLPRFLLTVHSDDCWLTTTAVIHSPSDAEALASTLAAQHALILGAGSSRGEGPHAPARTAHRFSNGTAAKHRGDEAAHGRAVEVSEVRAPADWRAVVAEAAETVRRGDLEKVVLARRVVIRADEPLDVPAALQQLRAGYPSCYVFAVARGDRVFLGATPERLVHLRDGEVRATCLAGSRRRGTTTEEDRQLGTALLTSEKDRTEHAIVVRALREALRPVCTEVSAPDQPSLLSVRNVHHLHTPVSGRLANGACLLDLVARLHPTPAVGGFPTDAALCFIREREGLERGWYAAPVGWLDRHGEGEFVVALRSALVVGHQASLFAGCGIMADSDPGQEYAESWLKLRPMLSALGSREP
jgi:salicylate biosynthesis isochorismate synthase